MQIRVKEGDYQHRFLSSKSKFPALIAGVGTGKTLCLLTKIYEYCETYPGTTALIVRKEYTDLKDSTIKDFQTYFECTVGADKDYKLPNGSVIMFRHADELMVLKNLNLGIVGVEQAEEFFDETQFTFLRDRLRQNNGAPVLPICIIANANGRNWIYRMWISNPASADFEGITATTFDNARNLRPDFIADLKRMETEAPAHYRQFVLNDFNESSTDDALFTAPVLYASPLIEVYGKTGIPRRVMAVDVARFGNDETVYSIIETYGALRWEQILQQCRSKDDTMQTVGRAISFMQEFNIDITVVDEGGIGGGVVDRLNELNKTVVAFDGARKPKHTERYYNLRSEGYFELKELFDKGWIKIINDPMLMDQLLSITFKFNSNGTRMITPKDVMRKNGLKSPDRADALMMAVTQCGAAIDRTNEVERFARTYNTDGDIEHVRRTDLPAFASMA